MATTKSAGQDTADDGHDDDGIDHDMLQHCIEECLNCHATCTATAQCGVDPDFGECVCQQSANGTAVCNPPADQVEVASCAACPPNTNCFAWFGGFVCIAACRTA